MQQELNHSTRLYFPYTFDSCVSPATVSTFSKEMQSISICEVTRLATCLDNESSEKLLKEKVWKQQEYKIDPKIHKFANKLINGVCNIPNCDGFFGMQPFSMSPMALKVLNNGSLNSKGKGVLVQLKKAAITRLEQKGVTPPKNNDSWPMTFDSVWFFGLNTGIGIMVVDVSFRQPDNKLKINSFAEILELNYIIARNNNNSQSPLLSWDIPENMKKTIKGFSTLIEAFIPQKTKKIIQLKSIDNKNYTYTYSYVSSNLEHKQKEKNKFIYRLSRKYNDLYFPDDISNQIVFFDAFKGIKHGFCLEGAVSYIDLTVFDKAPESIVNFHRGPIKMVYAPLVLLTYGEYLFLHEMANNTADEDKVDMRNPTENNLAKLRDYRAKLYDYRLNFSYTQISGSTLHNMFADSNKTALSIKQLLENSSTDAHEIEQYIADQVSQVQDARMKKFGVLASLFAIIIGWVDLWGLSLHEIFFGQNKIKPEPEPESVLIFLVALLFFAFLVIYISRPSKLNVKRRKEDE